jgi:hypothetical protein
MPFGPTHSSAAEGAVRHSTVKPRLPSGGERLAEAPVVVDDEDAAAAHDASARRLERRQVDGERRAVTGLARTAIQPPMLSTIACATARPRPMPSPAASS